MGEVKGTAVFCYHLRDLTKMVVLCPDCITVCITVIQLSDRMAIAYNKIKIMLEETICLAVVRKRRKNRL